MNNLASIAIIGLSGRFPGANNIEEFWQNLQAGIESISEFTEEELKASGIDVHSLEDPHYVKRSGILDNIEYFDAGFFDLTPKEAELTDPQHRLFLECAWEALESAGYDSHQCDSRIGVYGGSSLNNYLSFNPKDAVGTAQSYQKLIGNDKDFLTTRVSYKLNLTGPSLTVQTACSTSLVAVNLACQSLINYQCDMALAGGVSIRVPQKTGYLYQPGGPLSPDGHCRAFDANAQGTTVGNGVGVVLLKRLEEALADGDTIYAVIKGWATNNDGSLKVGYTAPSVDGQAEAIAEAMLLADVEAETISYIEAHGTGTTLGDPIEMAALTQVFRASTDKTGFCAIGSVKTNIGHLDAAAGVTGLIKTVLALKHQQIPASLNFETPNPEIDFANSPFYVNTQLTALQQHTFPRRAGVSALGMGGTNAHVILEEAPTPVPYSSSRPWQLVVISAKTESALESATQNLAQHLTQHPDVNLADVAYTLQVGRRGFNYRRILVCKDVEDALKTLQTPPPQRVFTAALEPANRAIAFMFSGQGSQYVNMGKELYETESSFRDIVDHCCAFLKPLLNLDLRTIIYPDVETLHAASLQETSVTQPALFVIEYALAQLWISWGISPSSMIGHSIGEYVAACLAGVLSLEDALKLVALRGRLMQQLPKGSMLSIPLPASEVIPLLNEDLALAAINAPSLCAVSGTDDAIARLAETLNTRGIECRRLQTSHAFHSQMMDDILQPFIEAVKTVQLNPPEIPYISNVTGTWITVEEATNPDYYAQHLRQTVCFSTGIIQLLEKGEHIFLEVGPGRTLTTLVKQHIQGLTKPVILSSLRHPQEDLSDLQFLLQSLGRLWLAGVEINWASFYQQEQRCRVPLPTYPFERQRYWLKPEKSTKPESKSGKNPNLSDWFYVPSWKRVPLVSGNKIDSDCTLIFIDESKLGVELIQYLQQLEQTIITVKIGEKFSQLNDQSYTLNPAETSDYQKLLQQLKEQNKIPDNIIHLWSVLPLADDVHIDFSRIQNLGFYSLVYLAQAIAQQQIQDKIQLFVISNHLYKIAGTEELYPEKATLLGACKVIPQEYLNLNCRLIEVDNPSLLEPLKLELTTASEDAIVAYRNQSRWVQTFEKVILNPPTKENLRLRQGGVYLITGGMGGIGLTLAEYLAKTVQAKLILLGRSLPLENSPQLQKINQLKAEGSEIMLLTADVSHKEQMQNAIAQSLEQFGRINGVIHAAGIAGDGIIQFKTPEIAEKVFAPKINGTFILNHLLKDQNLDFFVLCSSLSSIQGGIGQVDYCAANAFLDAFAEWNSSQNNQLTIAINWDTWQQVGMAVNSFIPNQIKSWYENQLKNGILPTEGMDIFSRILANSIPQVIVSTQNLSEEFEELKQFIASISFPKKSAELSPNYLDFLGDEIETEIAKIWQEIIGLEKVNLDDNFFELGGHSLLAVQTISRLRETFGVDLPVCTLLKDAPTIRELATVITEKQVNFEDVEDIEQLLAEIEGLSSSEIQEQLKIT